MLWGGRPYIDGYLVLHRRLFVGLHVRDDMYAV